MPTILIVEDQADIRQLLTVLLRMDGYDVVEANDGRQALDLLQGGVVCDLIISDMKMPQMQGDELARELAADPVLANVPIIILSGTHTPNLPSNVVAQSPKPLDVVELLYVIKQHTVKPAPG